MEDCIFCKIGRGEVPAAKVLETDDLIAFDDIKPSAPVHVLIVPKKHIDSAYQVSEEDAELVGKMVILAEKVADKKEIAGRGYRLVFNVGKEGGQVIKHLHLHVLGGRQMAGHDG